MANTIQLRRSATANAVPTTTQLALGELAINTNDGRLYLKKNISGTETIVEVGTVSSGDQVASADLVSNFSSGDEGGQIRLSKSVTNTTLTTGITIDVFQNKLRIFETGGTTRGVYIDLSAATAGVGTNLLGTSMTYPSVGIPLSTGTAWGTSFNNSGSPITVSYGGTGASTLANGYLLKGNDTAAISSSVLYDSGGYIGIGTTGPGNLIDAQETFNGEGGLSYYNGSTGAASAASITAGTAGGAYFYHKITRATGVVQFRGVSVLGLGTSTLNQDFNIHVFRSTGGSEYARFDSTGNFIATGSGSFAGGIAPRVVSITDATSITLSADTTDVATQINTQVAGTLTINAPTGTVSNGEKIMLRIKSTNVQTFSWNAIFAGSTDAALPTTTSGAGKTDYLGFQYDSTATKWHMIAKNFGF